MAITYVSGFKNKFNLHFDWHLVPMSNLFTWDNVLRLLIAITIDRIQDAAVVTGYHFEGLLSCQRFLFNCTWGVFSVCHEYVNQIVHWVQLWLVSFSLQFVINTWTTLSTGTIVCNLIICDRDRVTDHLMVSPWHCFMCYPSLLWVV